MLVRSFGVTAGVAVCVAVLAVADAGNRIDVVPLPDAQVVSPPLSRAACQLSNYTGPASYYSGAWATGNRYVDLHNPEDCSADPAVPFEITSVDFSLHDPGGSVWPCSVTVVVYDAYYNLTPDTCWYPGAELCRQYVVCDQATFQYPNMGNMEFAEDCCVNGRFFIGLEYTGTGVGPWPSLIWDNGTVDSCYAWFYLGDQWVEQWVDRCLI